MDLISDTLTRIRNAAQAGHTRVQLRHSKLIERMVEILRDEGYVRKFQVLSDGPIKEIRAYLRKDAKNGYAMTESKRISKSSRRVYCGHKDLPVVKNGLGVCIVSTSKGVMTAENARSNRLGGEILCTVF